MLNNHLMLILRNLCHNKPYPLLTYTGLVIGLSNCLISYLTD
ncbi:hypothetical protein [Rhodocytophaga aerolata]